MIQQLQKGPDKVGRRKKLKQVNQNLQAVSNSILWALVHGVGGSMDVPVEELKSVPPTAHLDVKLDTENKCFVIKAVTPEKKLIEVPRLAL